MRTRSFDRQYAVPAHEGTCLSMPVLPEGMQAPFWHAWVLVPPRTEMVGHAHETREVYVLVRGESAILVGNESRTVAPYTAVEIPAGVYHAVRNDSEEDSLWLVLYWEAPGKTTQQTSVPKQEVP
ncbi:MAG: cupin domain-containing protein [Anaerolineae bacterium]